MPVVENDVGGCLVDVDLYLPSPVPVARIKDEGASRIPVCCATVLGCRGVPVAAHEVRRIAVYADLVDLDVGCTESAG